MPQICDSTATKLWRYTKKVYNFVAVESQICGNRVTIFHTSTNLWLSSNLCRQMFRYIDKIDQHMQADSGSCARSSVIGCDERSQNLLSAGVTKGAASSAYAGPVCLCSEANLKAIWWEGCEKQNVCLAVAVCLAEISSAKHQNKIAMHLPCRNIPHDFCTTRLCYRISLYMYYNLLGLRLLGSQ